MLIIGWSKIQYNGGEVYIATRLLSLEKPDETSENEVINETVNENIVNNETPSQNKTEMERIQEEIGVLPEVGINVSIVVYRFISLFAIIISLLLIRLYFKKFRNQDDL